MRPRREFKCAAVVGTFYPTENPYQKLVAATEQAKNPSKTQADTFYNSNPQTIEDLIAIGKEWGEDYIMTCGASGCKKVKQAVGAGLISPAMMGWTPKKQAVQQDVVKITFTKVPDDTPF